MRAMFRSRSSRENVSPADSSRRTRSPSSSDTVRSPRSSSASRRSLASVDFPDPDSPVKNTTTPRWARGGRARRSSVGHARGHQPGGHLAAGVEQLAELAVGQLAPLHARLDQAERPPDLGGRVVGPLAFRQDRYAELGKVKVRCHRRTGAACSAGATRPPGGGSPRRRPRPRRGRAAPRRASARGGSGTGTTSVLAGSCPAAARTARTSASGRVTRSAGPATSGSSRMRARSWSARCRSWPICRWPSGRLVA